MADFKVGDRVGHSESDLADGYFEKNPEGRGTVTRVDPTLPYPVFVLWDQYPEGVWESGSSFPHLESEVVPA